MQMWFWYIILSTVQSTLANTVPCSYLGIYFIVFKMSAVSWKRNFIFHPTKNWNQKVARWLVFCAQKTAMRTDDLRLSLQSSNSNDSTKLIDFDSKSIGKWLNFGWVLNTLISVNFQRIRSWFLFLKFLTVSEVEPTNQVSWHTQSKQ